MLNESPSTNLYDGVRTLRHGPDTKYGYLVRSVVIVWASARLQAYAATAACVNTPVSVTPVTVTVTVTTDTVANLIVNNCACCRVHWCVSGHPRLSLFLKDMPLSTEVISTYFFDSKGRIYEHQVDQLIPPESLPVKFLEWLVGRLQPRAIPQPQLPIPGA